MNKYLNQIITRIFLFLSNFVTLDIIEDLCNERNEQHLENLYSKLKATIEPEQKIGNLEKIKLPRKVPKPKSSEEIFKNFAESAGNYNKDITTELDLQYKNNYA